MNNQEPFFPPDEPVWVAKWIFQRDGKWWASTPFGEEFGPFDTRERAVQEVIGLDWAHNEG